MNLLCPNCRKLLTVPDQSAGQRMRCPLCSGEFTVPALPQAPGATPPPSTFPPASTPAPPTSAPPPPSFPSTSSPSAGSTTPGTYGLTAESRPTPPPFTPPPPMPAESGSAPSSATTSKPSEPAPPLPEREEAAPEPAGAEKPCCRITFDPRVFDWIPVACFFLILILTLFTWVRFGYSGFTLFSQNAWQAAFNSVSDDTEGLGGMGAVDDTDSNTLKRQLNMNWWTLFYLILLFLSLGLAIVCAILPLVRPRVSLKIPDQVERFLPWRSALVVVLALARIFFLTAQVLFGFSLENQIKNNLDSTMEKNEKALKSLPEKERAAVSKGLELQNAIGRDGIRRGGAFTLVYLLQLLAIIGAGASLALALRGNRPPWRVAFYG